MQLLDKRRTTVSNLAMTCHGIRVMSQDLVQINQVTVMNPKTHRLTKKNRWYIFINGELQGCFRLARVLAFCDGWIASCNYGKPLNHWDIDIKHTVPSGDQPKQPSLQE